SLEQQNDYFRIIIASEDVEKKWILNLKEAFMSIIYNLIPINEIKTFNSLRIMRMIHELDYILQYQPYLTWQIEIIQTRILDFINQ
ncbi:MAG: hypothetical protein ACFFD1_14620, partial [Candidatus Thorarchaeota archaeon]